MAGACKSGSKVKDSEAVADPNAGKPVSMASTQSLDTTLVLSKEQEMEFLNGMPDGDLTLLDQLKRDWLNGYMSRTDYLKQILCYLYDPSCLVPQYKPDRAEYFEEPCSTSRMDVFLSEIAASNSEEIREMRAFWKMLTGQREISKTMTKEEPILDAPSQEEAAEDARDRESFYREVYELHFMTTENGLHSFAVFAGEPRWKKFQKMTDKLSFEADGKPFEIFFNVADRDKVAMIVRSFQERPIVSKSNEITPADPQAIDVDHEKLNSAKAYRLFLIDSASDETDAKRFPPVPGSACKGKAGKTVAYVSPGPDGRSYMAFGADAIGGDWHSCFVRDEGRVIASGQKALDGVAAHEWMHAKEVAHFGGLLGRDNLAEAFADWGQEYVTPDANTEISHALGHLYQPQLPVWLKKGFKAYGTFLWFMLLADRTGNIEPIRQHLAILKEKKSFLDAFYTSAEATPFQTVGNALHALAESGLNLKADIPGVLRFGDKHDYWENILSQAEGEAIPLPDTKGDPKGDISRVDVSTRLARDSIRYLVLAKQSTTGNTFNHFYKVDAEGWLKEGGRLSLFGLKVDNRDPQKYSLVAYDNFENGPVWEKCFDEVDTQPDVVMLAYSYSPQTKTNTGSSHAGAVTIYSKPFCQPVPISATRRHFFEQRSPSVSLTVNDETTLEANLDWLSDCKDSIENYRISSDTSYIIIRPCSEDWPKISGSLGWRHSTVSTGLCGTGSTEGSQIFQLKSVGIDWSYEVVESEEKGSYSFWFDVEGQEPYSPIQGKVTFMPACGCGASQIPGACASIESMQMINGPEIGGLFQSGATTLGEGDRDPRQPKDPPEIKTSWTISLTQPLEVQREGEWGEGMRLVCLEPDCFPGQFRTPLFDLDTSSPAPAPDPIPIPQ